MTAASQQLQIERTQEKTRPRRRWMRLLLSLLALLALGLTGLGLWPVPADFAGDERTAGVAPDSSGLRRAFPPMVIRSDNPLPAGLSDERVELGRLLFFDPILSGDNTMACATCHHPDLGFSDGRGQSSGKGGRGVGPERSGGSVVKRGAPTLWNALYNHKQFWDGRAEDLEEQAKGPITSDIEMNEDPERLVQELKAIPEYLSRFEKAFGGLQESSVTIENVQKAVASFERRLTTNNSPFDRYVNGDLGAITAAQKRGFNIFRSGKTRCFECHGLPAFANRDFKIIGVPDLNPGEPDYGRFEVTQGEGNKYAFKVPTLRNVVLNAPYMHNGKFKTLEEVLDFYAAGGGPGVGFKDAVVDDKIHSYTITKQEKEDLIAFLYSLTDESNLPAFPSAVPSGLPIVARLQNPARELIARYNSGATREESIDRAPQTLRVKPGESIQAAVDRSRPGDRIEVEPGTYHEEITIDLNNIRLRGLSGADGRRPLLDGQNKLADAIIATGDDFQIENFDLKDYTANGVVVQHARGPVFRDLFISHTGLYGVYPVSCNDVTIENCVATGIADAALYVGQSRDIVVRNCEAYGNVTGIEIENSINSIVENNYCHDNTGGILVFILPNNPSKAGRNCKVVGNRVIDNNHPNFGHPNSIVSNVPPGTGVLVMAADDNEVTGNEIRGNDCYGVAVFSLEVAFPKGTAFDVGATPERNWIHDNTFSDNGRNPAGALVRAGIKGADLVWDLSGWSNRWQEPAATKSTPILSAGWPALFRRAYWRMLTFAQEHL